MEESSMDEDSSSESDSSEDMTLEGISEHIRVRRGMRGCYQPILGDTVEVWWTEEDKWFEGEVIDCRDGDRGHEFRVHYVSDSQKLWHDSSVRIRAKI